MNAETTKRDRAEGYKKVAMQAKPELWARVKVAASIEEREVYLLVCEAIELYLQEKYPNLDIQKMKNSFK